MKKYIPTIALLVALFIISGIMGVFASDQSSRSSPDFNYSNTLPAPTTEISPSMLISLLLPNTEISDAEAEYLDKYSNCFFLINDRFSNDLLSVSYENEELSVKAKLYSYTASNGATVNWIPDTVILENDSFPLSKISENEYFCSAPIEQRSSDTFVSVDYSCSISIPAEDADYLINYAFRKASAAVELEKEYTAVLKDYLENYRRYEQYLEDLEKYESDLENYEKYLVLKAEYEKDLASYLKYLDELSAYEKKLAEYNKYLADYEQYIKDKSDYEKIYSENLDSMQDYINYYTQLNKIRASMYAIENIYTKPDANLQPLFNALQNKEMVALFEKHKHELTTIYGVKASTIDRLSELSDELNELLVRYGEERKISEQAAFEFYSQNYDQICYLFNYLYDSMVEIMTPTIFNHICVKIGIDYKDPEMAEYKKWRITNVLSQIYLVSRCLDDTQVAEGSWQFYNYSGRAHTYYFTDLLAPNIIISDTNAASPAGLSWPENTPDFVLPPVPVEPPMVLSPPLPEEVDEPTSPTVYSAPTKPEVVNNPGDAPAKLDDLLKATHIVEALTNGTLTERDSPKNNVTLEFKHTVNKLISFENKPVMTVYDHDMTTILLSKVISSESDFFLPSASPQRDPDNKYIYTFEGWSISPNELIEPTGDNIPSLADDFCIYAIYSSEERLYSVTWVTADGVHISSLPYGAIPSFEGNTEKAPTQTISYVFDGWFPMPDTVTEDITYTAQYREETRKYSVMWKMPNQTLSQTYLFNELPIAPTVEKQYIIGCELFTFEGWNKQIVNITEDVEYTATYSKTLLVSSESSSVSLSSSNSAYSAKTDGSSVVIENLLALANAEGKKLELTLGELSVSMDRTAVSSLAYASAQKISVELQKDGNDIVGLSVKILDTNGNNVRYDGDIRFKIPSSISEKKNFFVYSLYENNVKKDLSYTLSEGTLSFMADGELRYSLKQLYSVAFAPVENGGAIMDSYIYEEGAYLSPTFYPAVGYSVSSITVTRLDNGVVTELTSLDGFVMPDSDISINVKFEKTRYNVQFIVNGECVSSENYIIGEMPLPPEIASEYENNGYRYVFSGWSPTITIVTGNATYTAKYNCFLINTPPSQDTGDAMDTFINETVLPIVAVTLLIVAITISLVVIIKRSFKRKS